MLDDKKIKQLDDLCNELAFHYNKTNEIIEILGFQKIYNIITGEKENPDYINNLYDEATLRYYKSYCIIQKIMDILKQHPDILDNKVLLDEVSKKLELFKKIISELPNREKLCN